MLRRLLTCLALVTGLTAVTAPAQANVTEAFGVALELTQRADPSGKGEAITCVERKRDKKLKSEKQAPCRPADTVTVVIPTVMFGPDRAFE